MTLYETLDLNPPEAGKPAPNAEQIKRAYKKKAKETHPDKGGTAEAFAKISRAYLVLSDPIRRAKYDATGDIPEITPESTPLNMLVQFFVTVVQMFANGRGPDPTKVNLIQLARDQFRKDILDAENEQMKLRRAMKLWQDVADRFASPPTVGKKPNVIKLSLTGQIAPLEQRLRLMDEQIAIRKDALKLLDGYTFRFDEQPQQQYASTVGNWRLS